MCCTLQHCCAVRVVYISPTSVLLPLVIIRQKIIVTHVFILKNSRDGNYDTICSYNINKYIYIYIVRTFSSDILIKK